jgi:arylsulfatase A-like enzyme
MTRRTDVFKEPDTVVAARPDLAVNRLGPLALLAVSAWCGLVSGLAEAGTIVVRKRLFDLNHFYQMSEHFIWLIPLTNLAIFLILGLILLPLQMSRSPRVHWLVPRLLGTLALLPVFWAAFPRIYSAAGFLLALGIATQLVTALERRANSFRLLVRLSLPIAAGLVATFALLPWGAGRLRESREASRSLPPPGAKNILLVVLDTVGTSHLNLYGYRRSTCPTIIDLARRAVRFDRVQASSSWTLPSHATMFTGRWPHEVSAGWLTPLDAVHPTLAEFLAARGYATAGFAANHAYCATDSGLSRGFTVYQDYTFPALTALNMAALVNRPVEGFDALERFLANQFDLNVLRPVSRRLRQLFNEDRTEAEVINREFLDWLFGRRQSQRPFFAFLNFYDAHFPYRLPASGIHRFGSRPRNNHELDMIDDWLELPLGGPSAQQLGFLEDCYDDCIADLDEQLGRLVDALKRRSVLERTWVIIVGDHGESFGEHSRVFLHGRTLYQAERHVPLLVIPPAGHLAQQVVSEVASLRDLPATIVDVLGLQQLSPFPGTSLARYWNGPQAVQGDRAAPAVALSEVVPLDPLNPDPEQLRKRPWPLAALSEGDWTYIRRDGETREELFRVSDDAREQHNLAAVPAVQPTLERMRKALERLTDGPLTPERFNR